MSTCTLCDLPVGESPIRDDAVDGTFCCTGCLHVYQTLGDVDPEEHKQVPEDDTPVPDDAETAYLSVDGMHCSTCELFLESTADTHDGLHRVEASYATETVKTVYDPETTDPDAIADGLSGMGYAASRRDEDSETGTDDASRLLVGAIFGMMAMTWYAVFLYPTYFGYDPIVELGTFDGAYLYSQLALLTAIILLYTGRPILRGAYVSLRTGRPNVDLLVTVAALAAYTYSTGRLLTGGTDLYYDVTIVVVLAVTIGNYYESRIKRETAGLLAELTELQVEQATLRDGEQVPVESVEAGEELRVNPGERIPVDGTVIDGTAAVDEALVTGESLPETKRPGDTVRGGTVVTDAPLVVEAGDTGSTLDRVVGMLWDIQASRPGAQRIADKLAMVFVPLVLALAVLVAGFLLVTGSAPRVAVLTGLTVLIVSCPCALGLATPLAVASGLQSAASRGVVVTTPALFEHGGDVDTVVFDKTGTLTDGEMTVTDVFGADESTVSGADESALLARASAVEQFSEHPIGGAIVEESGDTPADSDVSSFERHARGVSATVDGTRVLVGHPALLEAQGYSLDANIQADIATTRARGDVPCVVGWAGQTRGLIAVGDTPRTEWERIAETLAVDHRVVVLTGDDGPATARLRNHSSIDEVFAGVPPDGKAETVRRLAATETVAMVGDGSNDAPALAAADVGIAMETGTKLATDAADAIVLEGDLESLPAVFAVATGTKRRIRENLAWAFFYNGVAIPLALSGLLNPLFAAVAMASSSLLVVANSSRDTHSPDTEQTSGETQSAQGPTGTVSPAS